MHQYFIGPERAIGSHVSALEGSLLKYGYQR